jgi:hypothetical protein
MKPPSLAASAAAMTAETRVIFVWRCAFSPTQVRFQVRLTISLLVNDA